MSSSQALGDIRVVFADLISRSGMRCRCVPLGTTEAAVLSVGVRICPLHLLYFQRDEISGSTTCPNQQQRYTLSEALIHSNPVRSHLGLHLDAICACNEITRCRCPTALDIHKSMKNLTFHSNSHAHQRNKEQEHSAAVITPTIFSKQEAQATLRELHRILPSRV